MRSRGRPLTCEQWDGDFELELHDNHMICLVWFLDEDVFGRATARLLLYDTTENVKRKIQKPKKKRAWKINKNK